ncbi:MAG: hypothetical protein ACRBBJ_08930 [Rhodomicrobiaceae bacterium]
MSKKLTVVSNSTLEKDSSILKTVKKSRKEKKMKLHLEMDLDSYTRLVHLKGALQADSLGEVVRRALQIYEIIKPDDEKNNVNSSGLNAATPQTQSAKLKSVYIPMNSWMKEQLDREKLASKKPYREIIRQALRVLMQVLREREKLVSCVKKGNKYEKILSTNNEDHLQYLFTASA